MRPSDSSCMASRGRRGPARLGGHELQVLEQHRIPHVLLAFHQPTQPALGYLQPQHFPQLAPSAHTAAAWAPAACPSSHSSYRSVQPCWEPGAGHAGTAKQLQHPTESGNCSVWKSPLRSSSLTITPALPRPSLIPVPKFHIHMAFKSLQGFKNKQQ